MLVCTLQVHAENVPGEYGKRRLQVWRLWWDDREPHVLMDEGVSIELSSMVLGGVIGGFVGECLGRLETAGKLHGCERGMMRTWDESSSAPEES